MEESPSSCKFQSIYKNEPDANCIKNEEVDISKPFETVGVTTCAEVNMMDRHEELFQIKTECVYNSDYENFGIETENEIHEMNSITVSDDIKLEKIDVKYEPLEDPGISSVEHDDLWTLISGKASENFTQENNLLRDNLHSDTSFASVSKITSTAPMHACDICGYKVKKLGNIKRHKVIHSDDFISENHTFVCCICTYETKNRQHLNTHLLTHSGSSEKKTYKCDVCDYATLWKESLTIHRLIHKDASDIDLYACDECSYYTNWKTDLKKHISNHRDPLEVQTYKCTICNYETKRRQHLNSHMLTHVDLSGNVNDHTPPQLDRSEQMYKCEQCDYKTRRKNNLNKHRVVHKSTSETDIYACDMCGYTSKRKSDLKKHVLVHKEPSEVKMYKCANCDYESKYKHHLNTHVKLKHLKSSERRIYKCQVCEYTTRLEARLKSHCKVHKDSTETDMVPISI